LRALFAHPGKLNPDWKANKICEGAKALSIANRDQKPPDIPSDILLVLTLSRESAAGMPWNGFG
jgi:hypothetical protein